MGTHWFYRLYMGLIRGHYTGMVHRGREPSEALDDASYLVAISTWLNVLTLAMFTGISLPSDRVFLAGFALLSGFMSYVVHKKLAVAWRADIADADRHVRLLSKVRSERLLSWLHLLGSVVLIFVAATYTTSFD